VNKNYFMKKYSDLVIILIFFFIHVLIKYNLLISFDGPIIIYDEIFYKENAYYIFNHLKYYDVIYPPLYSISLLPAFILKSDFYIGMKFLNIVYSSSVILLTWLISKRYLSRLNSLIVAILVGLLPFQYIFPKFIMSENVFYPLFLLLGYLTVTSRDSNNLWNIAFAGIVMGLLLLTRYYAIILLLPTCCFYFFENFKLDKKIIFQNLTRTSFYLFFVLLISLPFYIGFGAFSLPFAEKKINQNEISQSEIISFKESIINDFNLDKNKDSEFEELIETIGKDLNFEKKVLKIASEISYKKIKTDLDANQILLEGNEVLSHNQEIQIFNTRMKIIRSLYLGKFFTETKIQPSNNFQFILGILDAYKRISFITLLVNILYYFLLSISFLSIYLISLFVLMRYENKRKFYELIFIKFLIISMMILSLLYYTKESISETYFMGRYVFYISPFLLLFSFLTLEKYNKLRVITFIFIGLFSTLIIALIYGVFIAKEVVPVGKHFIGYMNAPDAYTLLSGGRTIFFVFLFGNLILLMSLISKRKYVRSVVALSLIGSMNIYGYVQVKDFTYFSPDSRILLSNYLKENQNKKIHIYNDSYYSNALILHFLKFRNFNNFVFHEKYSSQELSVNEGVILSDSKLFLNDTNLISTDKSNYLYRTPLTPIKVIYSLVDEFKEENTDGYNDFSSPWGKTIIPIDKKSIFASPGTAMRFKVTIPINMNPYLLMRIGFHPIAKNWKISDGAVFSINLYREKIKLNVLDMEMLPDFENQSVIMNLQNCKGKQITLEFEAKNRQNKNLNGDWLVWEQPQIINIDHQPLINNDSKFIDIKNICNIQ